MSEWVRKGLLDPQFSGGGCTATLIVSDISGGSQHPDGSVDRSLR